MAMEVTPGYPRALMRIMARGNAALIGEEMALAEERIFDRLVDWLEENCPNCPHLNPETAKPWLPVGQPPRLPYAPPAPIGRREHLPDVILAEALRLLEDDGIEWTVVCERVGVDAPTLQVELTRYASRSLSQSRHA